MLRHFAELLSLHSPIGFVGNRADFVFGEWCTAFGLGRKVEKVFLDIGCEAGEVEDLSETSTGDLAGSGKIGLELESAGR